MSNFDRLCWAGVLLSSACVAESVNLGALAPWVQQCPGQVAAVVVQPFEVLAMLAHADCRLMTRLLPTTRSGLISAFALAKNSDKIV